MSEGVPILRGDYCEQLATMFTHPLFAELPSTSAMLQPMLGTRRILDDGREFVYCLNGAVNLAAGVLVTFISTCTNEQTVTVAEAQYDRQVTMTGTATLNQFADGMLIVTAGTGIGESYKIHSNTATSGGVFTINLYDAIDTTWSTTDTDISIIPNRCNAVVVNPTAATQMPVGVTQRPVTASYYFWAQTKGIGSLLMDTVGGASGGELDEKIVICSTNTAGYGMVTTTPSNADMRHFVGRLVTTADATNAEATFVDFCIT